MNDNYINQLLENTFKLKTFIPTSIIKKNDYQNHIQIIAMHIDHSMILNFSSYSTQIKRYFQNSFSFAYYYSNNENCSQWVICFQLQNLIKLQNLQQQSLQGLILDPHFKDTTHFWNQLIYHSRCFSRQTSVNLSLRLLYSIFVQIVQINTLQIVRIPIKVRKLLIMVLAIYLWSYFSTQIHIQIKILQFKISQEFKNSYDTFFLTWQFRLLMKRDKGLNLSLLHFFPHHRFISHQKQNSNISSQGLLSMILLIQCSIRIQDFSD
ncbi:unnamed protein product (macronuclear) [Paramecium tetraurelia]|uniref:Transmembrane protein n=1 Tax=Paramecium tetraurelia TaxID=5888 RepID=A0BM81_PARTE|nr:uncharacterized protein GSPATT00030282001 [Paramecium tetraurelia]CAK59648.1 unnamed protein product [Paramecium tetraurelia]|eukprot:XP_001427046.1 hypothetical protein (macronuclear) [Paramecium tetraurelia strain d4-2]